MHSPAIVASKYREQSRRLTPQRKLLFALMHGNEAHPTAEGLFAVASKRMPGISLRTVYQTLDELSEMGEIQPSKNTTTRYAKKPSNSSMSTSTTSTRCVRNCPSALKSRL
ncbi:MAG: transcriptional repressor [Acidimicrobiaceae bacterium]|nr:transcriptional repressor [Acidimicrobiaceae bacterium]